MFAPANNTPTTSEELASIGGVGANIDPAELKKPRTGRKIIRVKFMCQGTNGGSVTTTLAILNLPGRMALPLTAGLRSSVRRLKGRALSRQLLRYYDGKTTGKPLQTVSDIVSTWAPPPKTARWRMTRWPILRTSPDAGGIT
jgi:hypothetical protein